MGYYKDLEQKRAYDREWRKRPEVRERRAARKRSQRKYITDSFSWRNETEDPLVPDEVWAERYRRIAAQPRDLTAALFGDPLPGRSALDRERRA